MKKMLFISMLLIAGCATPQEIMQRPPDTTRSLKLDPQAAALCITRNIEARATNILVDRRPDGENWELISKVMGEAITVYVIARIRPEGTGSHATLWAPAGISEVERIIKGC